METFDYSILFNQALQKIKNIRSPHSKMANNEDLRWDDVKKQEIFNYGADVFEEHKYVITQAKEISISCLVATILYLAKKYRKEISLIEQNELKEIDNPRFALKDNESGILYIFKDVENCNFWKKTDEPEYIYNFMKKHNLTECTYIYLMYKDAYLQVIGYDENTNDPGHGTNVYSLMDFWVFCFNEDEKNRFELSLRQYVQSVRDCIGYIYIKTLTPNALINFRRLTEHQILKNKYDDLIRKKYNGYNMEAEDYPLLERQFFNEKYYQLLLGNCDFAESFITAEWLYGSMMKAKAIDLTVIGMGYLKAIEQLLFELIKINNKKETLNEKDFSIGAIATYYKNPKNRNAMLRNDIKPFTKTFVKEAIFAFADLRNGYFHKHNIHDENKIREIRNETYSLAFLLLGTHKLSEDDKKSLGIPGQNLYDDFYYLCEYINYHAGDFFKIETYSKEVICVALNDMKCKTINGSHIAYSGIYFRVMNEEGTILFIDAAKKVERISLMKLDLKGRDEVKLSLVEVKTVFANNMFVIPSVVEEEGLSY